MPRNKDLKRLVRARMQKTGERYTAARAVVTARRKRDASGQPAEQEPAALATGKTSRAAASRAGGTRRTAAPRSGWPALAGMSDEAVQQKTGRTWAGWVALLDAAEAHTLSHRDIASRVHDEPGVSGWWAQMVAVGYERIRGLRDVGQQCDGSYEASKSRTFGVPVARLYRMFAAAGARRTWLTSGWKRVRTSIPDRSLRVDWDDGTQVNFWFVSKGPDKCIVSVQHAKLASPAAIAEAKAAWGARLDALADALG